jgi:hypothetical protein
MTILFRCHDCEREIELAQRPSSGKTVCPSCQAMLVVPQPGEQPDEPGLAYRTVQVKRCPRCNKESKPAAVICIHCGHNFQTGRQTRQIIRVNTMQREWWSGPIPFFFITVRLRKTRDGAALVRVTYNLFYIPLTTAEVDLGDCDEIWTDYRAGFGVVGWTITLFLMLLCLLPGIIWWIWAFNKPTYIVRLPRIKEPPLTLYEGMSETTMLDLLDTITELGKLKIVRK